MINNNRYGYIYMTRDVHNNMYYIGQHKSSKFQPSYRGSGKIMRELLKKYEKNNFTVTLLCWCDDESELNNKEKFWIDFFKASSSPIFYNISLGGNGGDSFYYGEFSAEHRKHISEALKGRTPWIKGLTVDTDERVKKCAYSFKGKHHSEESRRKLSEAHKKENLTHEQIERYRQSRIASMEKRGTCAWYNDSYNEYFLNEAEYKIKIKENPKIVKGRLPNYIYMTKNGKSIKVHKTEIDKYTTLGYVHGKDADYCNNISKSRRLFYWHLDGVSATFNTSKELMEYMRNNGYDKISMATIQNIANGMTVKAYPTLTGKIHKIRKSGDSVNEN